MRCPARIGGSPWNLGSWRRLIAGPTSGASSPTSPNRSRALPAYLCIPKEVLAGKRRAPAVLCLHGTNMEVGHKVVVEPGSRRGRAYAKELAERGYVTLSPAYPHMANYWPNLGALGYASGTMKAIWDNSRGLDLLASLALRGRHQGIRRHRPVVGRAQRHLYGGAGPAHPGRGQQLRIRFLSGLLRRRHGPLVLWEGLVPDPVYAAPVQLPGTAGGDPLRLPRVAGCSGSTRPIFVNAPLRDGNFQWRSVDRCVAAAKPVYRLLGDEKNLIVRHPDCGHEFPDEVRHEAFRFIDSVLKGE